jgi:polysaccharide biosynthesis/export protein
MRILVSFLALFALLGVALAQQVTLPADYRVMPEDSLSIVTRDVSEASGQFLVRPDGKITFPIIGEVEVAGLTIQQIKEKLENLLSRELLAPHVTVNVTTMHMARVYVLGGGVRGNGIFDWKPSWRLTELVAAAGGLTFPPERVKAIVFRAGAQNQVVDLRRVFIDAHEASNIEIRPGDVVNFQNELTIRVQVIGQVGRQGMLEILDGQGAVEALAAAGGGAADAALSKSKVVRRGDEFPIDLREAVAKGRSELNMKLEDGDTLYVPQLLTRISVVGWVGRSGPLINPDGEVLTLSQAIAMAGGPVKEAKTDGVIVSRRDATGKVVVSSYDYKAILTGDPKHPDIPLQDGDIVFVAQSGRTNAGQAGSILGTILMGARLFFPF